MKVTQFQSRPQFDHMKQIFLKEKRTKLTFKKKICIYKDIEKKKYLKCISFVLTFNVLMLRNLDHFAWFLLLNSKI